MTRHRIDQRLARLADRLDQAARLKPTLDDHLAQQLAYCDTRSHNETGITASGTFSDPTVAAIMSRAGIVEKSNGVEECVVALESWLNQLDVAMRRAWGRERPAVETEQAPECYVAGCTAEVSSYRRADGTTAFRMGGDHGGMCDSHRSKAYREREGAA